MTITVAALADLAVDKEAPAEVVDEDEFVYRIEVTNNGPSDAEGVAITDRLPDGVEFVSAPGGCVYDAGTVRCDFATLASGGTAVVEIRVQARTPGQKDNTATLESSTDDPNDRNDSDTATTVVRPQPGPSANLSLEKSARPEPVTVGKKLTYTLTVENSGPDAATGVVVRDTLPQGVTFVSASDGCTYDAGARAVTCEIGELENGGSVTITIVVRVKKAGDLRNTATVESDAGDSDFANNADMETTTVKAASGGKGGNGGGGGKDGTGGGGNGGKHYSCSKVPSGKAKAGDSKVKGGNHSRATTKNSKAHGSCHGKGRAHVR